MDFDTNLIKGLVEPIVLRLLQQKTMYGYEIIREVNGQTNGRFAWKEGSLYPALHRMEADGLILGEWRLQNEERPRKYYVITRKGLKHLVEKQEQWRGFSQTVNVLLLA